VAELVHPKMALKKPHPLPPSKFGPQHYTWSAWSVEGNPAETYVDMPHGLVNII
jgi:hypothetical protein